MSKIVEQLRSIAAEKGPSRTVPVAQVQAIMRGMGRVEHLQRLADEYGYEMRLERKGKKRENVDGASKP